MLVGNRGQVSVAGGRYSLVCCLSQKVWGGRKPGGDMLAGVPTPHSLRQSAKNVDSPCSSKTTTSLLCQ